MSVRSWIQLHPSDNLIVALRDLPVTESLSIGGNELSLQSAIPAKHKFTSVPRQAGEHLYMYGVLVGKALKFLPAGSLITTKNIVHATQQYDDSQSAGSAWTPPPVDHWRDRTFEGYHRSDGRVGTANYWLVVPLVFCENRNVEVLKDALLEPLGYGKPNWAQTGVVQLVEAVNKGGGSAQVLETPLNREVADQTSDRVFPRVDGIKFLTHQGGCGGTRDDAEALCELLAGYICNPNVGGATVLSLGCQNAQIAMLTEAIQRRDPDFDKPLRILEQQGGGSEKDFIERAIKLTFTGLMEIDRAERRPASLSKLTLGLECGGSDGFSGISANPALGHVSDILAALGGQAILAEFPELNGIEQELVNRCATPELATKFTTLMRAYASAAEAVGSGFENNPSPGNIRDGLITDAIKSAGAARKGGTSPVTAVLDYAAPAPAAAGLTLLCTPGNDVESTTGLAGSGANLIVFTTGLGTPTGNPVAPVVKMSSNHTLAERMGDLIDFDAGSVITGQRSIAEAGEELLEYLIEVASGRTLTAAQRLGQDDFIPWKRGVSL